MSLFSKIKNQLSPLDIPVRRLKLSSSDTEQNYDEYIIVTEYNQTGGLYADDEELETVHNLQLSLFTRLNFVNRTKKIKSLLKLIGFTRTSEFESYENQTGYYHKVIRFSYVENNENGE